MDIRDDDKVQKSVDKTVNAFGGIDTLSIKPFTNDQKTIPIR